MDTKEIEYKLGILAKPFEDTNLDTPILIRSIKLYIANLLNIKELSEIIETFPKEQGQALLMLGFLKQKSIKEIESRENQITKVLRENNVFDLYTTYLRLKLINEDAEERQVDEPQYNLSKIEKLMLDMDQARTNNSDDIDLRYENLSNLILFLRNSDHKKLLSELFTKKQLSRNCRNFISLTYLKYQKEFNKIDSIKKGTGWWIFSELERIASKTNKELIKTSDINGLITALNNELLAKLEFGFVKVEQKDMWPPYVQKDSGEKYYKLIFDNDKKLVFNDLSKPSFKYLKYAMDNLGLLISHEKIIELKITKLNLRGKDRYEKVKALVRTLNKRIKNAKLEDQMAFETELESGYYLKIPPTKITPGP